jgi:hypothetical protein
MLKTNLKPQIKFYFRERYKLECGFYKSWWGKYEHKQISQFIELTRLARKRRIKDRNLKFVWKGRYL